MRSSRDNHLTLLLLILAVALVFAPVLVNHAVPFGGDDAVTGRIFERQLAAEIRDNGVVPLWTPHVFGGMPTVDSLSYPVFYPLHALYSLFPRMREIFHHIPLHLVIAGLMAYLLALDFRLPRRTAALPALAFALTGYLVTLTMSGHGGKIWTCAYLPLVLFTQRRLLRQPTLAHAAAAGLAAGVQMLAGHYQIVFYTWLAAGLQLLWHLSGAAPASDRRAGPPPPLPRRLALWTAVPLLAVAIAAAQFVPAAKYAPWSNRAEPSAEFLSSFSFPPGELLTFGAPAFYGFSPDTGMSGYWGSLVIRGSTEYMGIAVLLLALIGAGTAGPRVLRWIAAGTGALLTAAIAATLLPLPAALQPAFGLDLIASCFLLATLGAAHANWLDRIRAPGGHPPDERSEAAGLLLLIGSWAAILMIGDHLPTYRFVAALPGFDRFRAPHTLVILVAFSVALLAGLGLDALLRARAASAAEPAPKSKRRNTQPPDLALLRSPITAPPIVLFALLATLLLAGLVLRQPLSASIANHLSESAAARIATMVGGDSSADAARALVGALTQNALGALAVATFLWGGITALIVATARSKVGAQTCVWALLALTFVELGFVGRDYVRPVLESDAFETIEANPLLRLVAEKAETAAASGAPVRVANLELNRIRPNDPVVHGLHLSGGYHGAPIGAAWDALHSDLPGFAERYLSLMGVRYLLYPKPLEAPGRYRPLANLTAEGRPAGPYLIEMGDVVPRARLVYEIAAVPDRQTQLSKLASPVHDPRTTAILDGPITPPLERNGRGEARIVHYSNQHVEVEVESSGRGLLVLSDCYYPGWAARVDGAETEVLRADHHLRGVVVGEGRHRVVFEFDPVENGVGAWISLVAALGIGGAMLVGLRRRRESAGA
ncbi:MAG: hypothetical protein CME06_14165 [Gemmatimonadetes bacterium]|nr:hypothetical protein [Gemmatimonadota bacterium]